MIKNFFWALALLLVQAPFVFSLNCDAISSQNKDLCNSIIQMNNLTNEEKLLIISNLDYVNNLEPDHLSVYFHNKIDVTSAPSSISTVSKTYVKNAWAKIFTLMPSIYYNNSLYVPSNPEVLTGFNYTLDIPADYYSPGYSTTNDGDCKRIYSITQNTAKNNIYINDIFSGEGKNVRITLNQDSKITSNYLINFKIKIDHYKWNSYCCKRRYGICRKTCYTCDFKSSETKEENILLEDSLNVKYYPNKLVADITNLKRNTNSNELKLNYSDSIFLSLQNSNFTFYKYSYNIISSFEPYNIYTIEAKDLKQINANNLIYTNNTINVKEIVNCLLTGYDFFNRIEKDCSLVDTKVNLSIQTNQTFYKLKNKILVNVHPNNIYVNLTYGNFSTLARSSITLDSKLEFNKIRAEYNGETAEKIIYVYDTSRFILIYRLAEIGIILILFYKLIKKYWRFK